MTTTMEEAFRVAGFRTQHDRLMVLAMEAWKKYPNYEGAGARRDYVRQSLCTDSTWSLIEEYSSSRVLMEAIAALLTRAREVIEAHRSKRNSAAAPVRSWSSERAIGGTEPRDVVPSREISEAAERPVIEGVATAAEDDKMQGGEGQASADSHLTNAPAIPAPVEAATRAGS